MEPKVEFKNFFPELVESINPPRIIIELPFSRADGSPVVVWGNNNREVAQHILLFNKELPDEVQGEFNFKSLAEELFKSEL